MPITQKESIDMVKHLEKQVKEVGDKLKAEFVTMKQLAKNKVEELNGEADKQNIMPIFDDTIKQYNQKKTVGPDFMAQALKRSLTNGKGLHFIDGDELQMRNSELGQRLQNLKKQTKIKLNSVQSLISEIDNMSLE